MAIKYIHSKALQISHIWIFGIQTDHLATLPGTQKVTTFINVRQQGRVALF
jgi:hypothetical protein